MWSSKKFFSLSFLLDLANYHFYHAFMDELKRDELKRPAIRKPIEVSIMGQKLQVRSASTEDYVSRVANFVNDRINEVLQSTKSVASTNVAILGAMNITDEYLRYREEKEIKIKEMEKKIQDLIELIDLQL